MDIHYTVLNAPDDDGRMVTSITASNEAQDGVELSQIFAMDPDDTLYPQYGTEYASWLQQAYELIEEYFQS